MALGCRRGQVAWLILQESLLVIALGFAAGLPLTIVTTRLLGSLLWHVAPADPASLTLGAAGFCIVVAAASLIPALRATHTDPMQSLRAE